MARHADGPSETHIRTCFKAYREHGILFVRDGGDKYGVSAAAKRIAPEYGIDYRTPLFAIHKTGTYGGIVGHGFKSMDEYAALVDEACAAGADFIKIMTTGIMDFGAYGHIMYGDGLPAEEVREMVRIAHGHGRAFFAARDITCPSSAKARKMAMHSTRSSSTGFVVSMKAKPTVPVM